MSPKIAYIEALRYRFFCYISDAQTANPRYLLTENDRRRFYRYAKEYAAQYAFRRNYSRDRMS